MGLIHPKPYKVKRGNEWILIYSDSNNKHVIEFYKKHKYYIGDNFIECLKIL